MTYETLSIDRQGSVVRLNLNRPDAHNAMNTAMIQDLREYFTSIPEDRSIRVVVIGATGSTFCAGGDIKEMRHSYGESREAQLERARTLDDMLLAIQYAPQVVIARVHGAALGGGVGLVCVADIAIAAEDATLAFPEVRRGIVPAVISPYAIGRVGLAKARELMLTGAHLDGQAAARAGLVTAAYPASELDARINAYIQDILRASPGALAACKALLFEVANKPPSQTVEYRIDLLNQLRTSAEGREGMSAFIEKRPPAWVTKDQE
jgi:methylglutaconyl-CoA hydratase